MGGSGWSIDLEPMGGQTPAPWSAVHEATMQLIWDAWREALPRAQLDAAWEWLSMGEDSLLTIGARDQDDDAPAYQITFWFYLSVEWPTELAEHWLGLALTERRGELEANLADLGYRLRRGSSYPEIGQHYTFIAVGDRIGQAGDIGVHWALPEYDFQLTQALSASERSHAEASRAGGPCECAYCDMMRSRSSSRSK
ncbi:hypothetical protein ACNOYE_32225 [Nannocystaceae bacterium ST9]